jgi:HSP20 family protein
MSRQYRLPDVDRTKVNAHYENGVLTLDLPKLAASEDNDSHIEID